MQREMVNNKVSVFISSNCNARFAIVREALKVMLVETGLCEVYVFEESSSSSSGVVQAYMNKLSRCDLVLILIDNNEKVGEGTLKEIQRAKSLNKKCIYLFCDEIEKKPTEIQNELMRNLQHKYQIVPRFSHLAEEAYKSVINDVMEKYSWYCSNQFENMNRFESIEDSKDAELVVIDEQYNPLKREVFKGYSYTKAILNNNIIFNNEIEDSKDEVDRRTTEILEVVIGNKKITDINFESLKKCILNLHSGRLKNIVELRLEAIYEYFNGNLENARIKLVEALKIAKDTKKIASWVVNDIAIDLRNIEIFIGNGNSLIISNSEGQTVLDENDEVVYLPVLDRLKTKYYEDIFKNLENIQFSSPFTTHFGGVDSIINQVVDIFVSGLNYGSLTYMLNIRDELLTYLKNSCIQYKNHKMFVFTIKMFLLCGKRKELKNFVRTYGEFSDNINDNDIILWENSIETIGVKYLRQISNLLLFEIFGNYFDDNHYEIFFNKIYENMEDWFKNPYAMSFIGNGYLNSIESNRLRLKHNKILKVVYTFFENNYKRWYGEIFKLLGKLKFEELSTKEINEFINWVKVDVLNDEVRNSYSYIPEMVLNFRMNVDLGQELDSLVKEHFKSYYDEIYSINIFDNKSEKIWDLILKRVESIKSQNNTQGKNGIYTGYGIDEYGTIINLIILESLTFEEKQTNILLDVTIGTLSSESQTFKSKTDALFLILILLTKYPKSEYVHKTVELIIKEREHYLTGKDILLEKGYSIGTLNFFYGLIKELYFEDNADFIALFSYISNEDVATKITILNLLNKILSCGYLNQIKLESQYILVYYLLDSSSHQDRDIRYYSYLSLINVYKYNTSYSKVVLNRLSAAIDGEVYENKVAILRRIERDSSDVTKYIFEKGCVDNHFLVRKMAKESK